MEIDAELLQQLLGAFQIDLEEQIAAVDDGFMVLIQKDSEPEARKQAFAALMRSTHNIKGAARGLSLDGVVNLSHEIETLFTELTEKDITPQEAFIQNCLNAFEAMQAHIAALIENQPTNDLDKFTESIIKNGLNAAEEKTVETKPEAQSIPDDATTDANNNLQEEPDHKEEPAHKIVETNDLQTKPARQVEKPVKTSTPSEIIRVQLSKLKQVDSVTDELSVTNAGMIEHYRSLKTYHSKLSQEIRKWTREYSKNTSVSDSKNDSMELLCNDLYESLKQSEVETRQLLEEMRGSVKKLNHLTGALRSDLKIMRLVPVVNFSGPLKRMAHSISQDLNKPVSFVISGEQVEVDRLILDKLQDPLIHLIRNAIDHGIESKQQRLSKGKKETGHISISFQSLGNFFEVQVIDDGAGIDTKTIVEVAVNKKLISKEQAEHLSETEKLDLVFISGFSSRSDVTQYSGRGVGLDVVFNQIRALGGSVSIKTIINQSTQFKLKLPQTLVSDRGLVLSCAKEQFIIPTVAVNRTIRFKPEEIVNSGGNQTVIVNKETIPLRYLSDILQLDESTEKKKFCFALILVHGMDKIALLVDDIKNEREIVLMPLNKPLNTVPNVMGATNDNKGNIIMVLNPDSLVLSGLGRQKKTVAINDHQNSNQRTKRILIVDDSLTTRTVEKNILESQGFDVVSKINGVDALDWLEDDCDFDLIITDIEMPKMDGFELTEKVKVHEKLQQIPVIIVSSLASEEHQRKGLNAGADAYIVKGKFDSQILLDAVNRLI
ncbi:MAG: response regulator [Methylococcaceae bacterium]|nr:response regulator [Methylococcaceae bacterium]